MVHLDIFETILNRERGGEGEMEGERGREREGERGREGGREAVAITGTP